MKTLNKTLCLLTACVVVFLSILCFAPAGKVSAEETGVGNIYKSYTGYEDSCIHSCPGVYIYDAEDWAIEYGYNSFENIIFQSRSNSSNFAIFNKAELLNSPIPFLDAIQHDSSSTSSELYRFTVAEDLYYIVYSIAPPNNSYCQCYIALLSTTPFYFVDKSDYLTIGSETGVAFCLFSSLSPYSSSCNLSHLDYYTICSDIANSSQIKIKYAKDTNSFGNFSYTTNNKTYYSFNSENVYTNCTDIDLSFLPNVDSLNATSFKSGNLADNVQVQLTPEFGMNMDRVFDQNTGQNDYFRLEVTNNSDTNIQFCAYIVEGEYDGSISDALDGTILDGIFTYAGNWEEAYWNYITDNQHYVDSYSETKKLGGLIQGEVKRYAELQKGNFYWILLKPDDHFEDFIYWENIKIKTNTEYSFFVDCIPTELDYPTDIFYTMTGDTKIFSFDDEVKDENYEPDLTLERYAINEENLENVFLRQFSVTSIPDFTTNVKGGNAKITSGWSDTAVQAANPYYRQDLSTGQIVPVENYSEFHGSLSDVNIDLDNIQFNDVKEYISYSLSFFDLIKAVISVFPAWVWILICFGLTALVVIGIIKALL